MIDTKVVKDESGTIDLCETFTDDKTKILKQVETNIIYGEFVIDIIAGFNGDKPYSRYTYEEVDKPEDWKDLNNDEQPEVSEQ